MHFRDKHSLCEHSDCLNKKFVVFTSEAELKVCLHYSGNTCSMVYGWSSTYVESCDCDVIYVIYFVMIIQFQLLSTISAKHIVNGMQQRHNATAHGGNMSRSQRNAALQVCGLSLFPPLSIELGAGLKSFRLQQRRLSPLNLIPSKCMILVVPRSSN